MKNILLVYKSTDNILRLKKLSDHLIMDNLDEDHSLRRLIIKKNENFSKSIDVINDSTHIIINSNSTFGMPTKEINDFLYFLIENKINCNDKKVYFVIDGYYKSANQVIDYLEYICIQLGFELGIIESNFSYNVEIEKPTNTIKIEEIQEVHQNKIMHNNEKTETVQAEDNEEIIVLEEEILDITNVINEEAEEIKPEEKPKTKSFIEDMDPLLDEVYDEIEIAKETSNNREKDIIYISMSEEICKVDKITGSVIPLAEGHGSIVKKNLKTNEYITFDIYIYDKAIQYFEVMKYLPVQYDVEKLECIILSSEINKVKLPKKKIEEVKIPEVKNDDVVNDTKNEEKPYVPTDDEEDDEVDEDEAHERIGIGGSIFGKAISKLKKRPIYEEDSYPKPITTQGEVIEIDDGDETTIIKSVIDVEKEKERLQKQKEEADKKKEKQPNKTMTEEEYIASLPDITVPYEGKRVLVKFDKENSIVIFPDGKKMRITKG